MLESATLNLKNEDLSKVSVEIYPNPAIDIFTLEIKKLKEANVAIYDVLGKLIYSGQTKSKKLEFSKSDGFSSGVYVIRVSIGNDILITKKLVVR
ncbi:T9SS type A sorting domain-containing protein [Bacteroidota bacterium]